MLITDDQQAARLMMTTAVACVRDTDEKGFALLAGVQFSPPNLKFFENWSKSKHTPHTHTHTHTHTQAPLRERVAECHFPPRSAAQLASTRSCSQSWWVQEFACVQWQAGALDCPLLKSCVALRCLLLLIYRACRPVEFSRVDRSFAPNVQICHVFQ